MSKELFVTSTPHETKLAVVEDDQLVEVFFERENEYTLAGSIYKGKVTRVLPGMQSAFVDIGLDRDAFLYVTDFLEEVESDEDETVSAAPKAEQLQNEEVREPREPRGDREGQGRQRRGSRDRDRGGRRPEQHRAAQSSELKPEPVFEAAQAEPERDIAEPSTADSGEQDPSDNERTAQPSSDRLPRRWRGRRGRRRGRSLLNESKYPDPQADAQTEQQAAESAGAQSAPAENSTLEPENTETVANEERSERQQPREEQREEATIPPRNLKPQTETREARQDRGREREPQRPTQRPQPTLLPGESLAKYNPRSGTAAHENAEQITGNRFQKPAPRPSTEVSLAPGSLSAGVLAGESLAKYRNRPAPSAERPREDRPEEQVNARRESVPQREERPHQHKVSGSEGYDVHAAHVAAEKHRHEPEQEQEQSTRPATEVHDVRGEYNFSPGSGVIEEEEITEEEHDAQPHSESFEDGEFEELEEETLEEEAEGPENKFIAASEGLAAALMENRDPTKVNAYASEEPEEDDPEESEQEEVTGIEQSTEEFEEDSEETEESLTLEGGYDGPDVEEPEADPEDPNYSGRAEMRGPSPTAGFQQKTDQGVDRARRGGRRGRPQRGGRPMRGGGPRRNIPRGPMPQINDLLKEGQEILVQIAKEPMAKKGARITSHIALPGRFLVFMPTVNHTGVSRKIGSEEERQRLKRILISEKGTAHGGFIVRTAATGASEEDLRADIRFLINLWGEIKQRAETSKAPALIYHDLNLVERILRDQVTTTFSQIWVDSENEYERILRFASRFQPSLVRRVKLYSKETPLFEEFNVQEEINKALKSKVWLKSGGYIVINQTEALVAIDINTGKYVGKTARLEDTIVKTNIDAIKEIVRQIRLRDLGGIIVIDFIDMDERKNRQRVMQALEEALKSDRSPSKVLQFNDFGLVAITRKRVKQSLERTLGTQCTYCTGTGMIKSVATICNEIYVELRKMAKHFDTQQITLRVNPEVGKALKENGGRWLLEMEELTKKTIIVKSDLAQHQEQFDIH